MIYYKILEFGFSKSHLQPGVNKLFTPGSQLQTLSGQINSTPAHQRQSSIPHLLSRAFTCTLNQRQNPLKRSGSQTSEASILSSNAQRPVV